MSLYLLGLHLRVWAHHTLPGLASGRYAFVTCTLWFYNCTIPDEIAGMFSEASSGFS
ncbi:hypothetical protein CPB86DRAFT_501587 [Serendipita vermifera]|nr:hypothetical protein CPB86DRAFT_501587 [Serendipita vermifera]